MSFFGWLACTFLHRGFYVRRAFGMHTTWTDCAKCGRKWSSVE